MRFKPGGGASSLHLWASVVATPPLAVMEANLDKLFGCPFVLESKYCAVIRTHDEGYAFGLFRYPRRAFEQIATYTQMIAAKRAFDTYNQAMRAWCRTD